MKNKVKYLFRVQFANGVTIYNSFWKNDIDTLIRNLRGWDKKDEQLGKTNTNRKRILDLFDRYSYTVELLEASLETEIEKWGQQYIDNDPNTISTRVGKWHPVVVKPLTVTKTDRFTGNLRAAKLVNPENKKTVYYINRYYAKALGIEDSLDVNQTYYKDSALVATTKQLNIV